MKYSSLRLLTILGSIALFVGAIFTYQALIGPAYDDIKQTQGELVQKQKDIKDFQGIYNQVQKILTTYQNYATLQSNVSAALPTDQAVDQAVNQVTRLASINGLSVQSVDVKQLAIAPSKSSLVKSVGTLRFSVKLTGSYESLKGYLQALESNIRLMSINSLKIEKAGSVSDFFNYNMEVDTYYQTQQ